MICALQVSSPPPNQLPPSTRKLLLLDHVPARRVDEPRRDCPKHRKCGVSVGREDSTDNFTATLGTKNMASDVEVTCYRSSSVVQEEVRKNLLRHLRGAFALTVHGKRNLRILHCTAAPTGLLLSREHLQCIVSFCRSTLPLEFLDDGVVPVILCAICLTSFVGLIGC
ncbi:hypothetical protein EDD16DRAFT_255537 [Pisolithus croceorrhizus]|nr:hypothetical protein EDD16DRAFT_255537 [Pisolithus croceorrhizus]